ncbi:reverse transcriptase domain-containing protein [Tanacetum coccineum]
MADNRTMAQLLQAPTEGYEDAIVIPEINANFELKHGLINLVQNKQFFGHDKEDPHAHIRYFNKITSTMRFPNVPSTSIKLMLFPFSLEGSARIWLEKEPPRSILTWDDLVSKFINQFFPPQKTTNLQLHQLDTFYNALNANDQDSLNSAAGGNFLDKMPRECLRIIESKSRVRNLQNKPVVAKVSSNSYTLGISPDVAALTTEVSELKNLIKTMLIDKQKAQAPATVKAVEQSCVTCGGAHSYKNCPATDGNVYQDNIQEYVSQAAAANFNQGNSNSKPPMVLNQIRPPGFPPIENNQNRFNSNQGNNFNQNRGTNFNQNRNFNQGQVYQPPTNQPPVYQAPTQQMQGVSKTDFENYVKANDAFITSNTASSSNSGTLPSQTVTNPREHVNAITTRSGKTCEGPSTPLVLTPVVSTPLKEPEQNPETSTNKVQKPSLESTAQPNSPKPTSYQPKLPYPERMKVRENDKPSAQHSRFLKMFKQLRLEIGLKDALVEMPKFNKWLSGLLRNKEKLEEIAITTVNAECSAIIMNKVPEKLEDPGKFLIPCALQELDRTNALADSGASINLLPHSIYKQLGLGVLTPTRMTLELANRSITHPMGIAEDVVVRVDGFTFLADFVVVNFEPDPRVPIILGRPFLRTAKALIDLYEEKLTLRVGSDELVFYAEKSEKSKNKQFAHAISVIDFSKDEPFSGSTTNHSDALPPSSSPVKTSDNLEEFADELTLLKKVLTPITDQFVWRMMNRIAIRKKIICLLANYLHQKPKPLSQEVKEIKIKEDKVSSEIPIDTIVMPIRITFDNPIDFNDHFSKPKDFKKDLTVAFDSTESSILPPPLLDSDSPFIAELSASITLNSLGNEDKVFKPGILVYHAIHDKNLITLEKNLRENISSGTLLFLKEPSSHRPPPEPPDVEKCLELEAGILITKVFKGVSKPHDFMPDILPTLPTLVSDLTFNLFLSFGSEDTIFDLGIFT